MLEAIFAVFFAPIPAFKRIPTVSRSFVLSAAILLSHGEITITHSPLGSFSANRAASSAAVPRMTCSKVFVISRTNAHSRFGKSSEKSAKVAATRCGLS